VYDWSVAAVLTCIVTRLVLPDLFCGNIGPSIISFTKEALAMPGLRRLSDSLDDLQIPPKSRYRWRADGNRDETFRVNFVGGLTPAEMVQLVDLLLAVVHEGAELGIAALTKVEFLEPDTCEYRYLGVSNPSDRVLKMVELWQRMHQIHPIRNVDGIPYPWLTDRG
jgi:hypothetical protein